MCAHADAAVANAEAKGAPTAKTGADADAPKAGAKERERTRAAWFADWLSSRPPLDRLRGVIISRYSARIYASGLQTPPDQFAAALVSTAVLAIAAAGAVAAAIALLALPAPALAAPLAIAILPPAIQLARPTLAVRARKNAALRELPFAATYLTIAAASEVPLTSALMDMSRLKTLGAFRREAERFKKTKTLYGMSPSEAVAFEAKHHPAEQVRDLIMSASAAEKSGSSLFLMMRDELVKSFAFLLSRLKTMSDKFSIIASAQMLVFIIVPMSVITVGIMFSKILGLPALFAACIAFPCLAAPALSAMIDSYFPKELSEPIPIKPFLYSLLAFPVAAAVLYVGWDVWLSATVSFPFEYFFALALISTSLPAAVWYTSARRRSKHIIEALPPFSRLVAEEVKKGTSPAQAIAKIGEYRTFNATFDGILASLTLNIKAGMPIAAAAERTRMPWIAKVYFELLDVAEQMGAEPKSMDALSELVNNIYNSIKTLDATTSLFKFSCYVNSVILPLSTAVVVELVVRLFANVMTSVQQIDLPLGLSFMTAESFPMLSLIVYSSVVLDAYLLGILGGKISGGGSVVDGLKEAVICIVIVVVALVLIRDMGLLASLFAHV